jgi:tRNA dimethylallyltransferase
MKVYRRMDIGTAKPDAAMRAEVRYHLVDLCEPWESYSAGRFVRDAAQAVAEIRARGGFPIFTGGTGLYFKVWRHGIFEDAPADPDLRRRIEERARAEGVPALHAELARRDPEAAARIHPNDFKRIQRALEVLETKGRPIGSLQTHFRAGVRRPSRMIVLRRAAGDLRARIELRLRRMIERGFVDEVRRLVEDPRGWSREPARSHGYWEFAEHLAGRLSWEEAVLSTIRRTWRYTRRQMAWWRTFPDVVWLDVGPDERVDRIVERIRCVVCAAG